MSLRSCLLLAIVFLPAYSQISDVTFPVLQSFEISPKSIDLRSGPKNVTFTLQITDDLSGVTGAAIYLFGPNDQWRRVYPSRASGTPLSGIYTAIVNFPQYFASGDWKVGTIYVADEANNLAVINIDGLGVEGGAFPGCECQFELLKLVSPSGRQKRWVGNNDLRLVSGSRNDGIWEATFVMPRYAESGVWKAELTLIDAAHNRFFADAIALAAAGIPSTITVLSTESDLEPPALTSFKISPRMIVGTSSGRQTVTLEFGVRDKLGGINFTYRPVCPPCLPVGVALISPSGNQRIETFGGRFTQVSGTPQIGTWTATATFPQYSEAGTWSVDVYLRDRNENDARILQPALKEAGFPSTLDVIRPSYTTPDGTVERTGGVIEDDVFGSRARLIIPDELLAARTTVSIDVLQGPLNNISVPQGFGSPGTRFVNIDLFPPPSATFVSPGYTVTIPLVDPLRPGAILTLFRLDHVNGVLVPARSVTAGDVIGTVDAGGQSATFTGIASFSTVVGLLPSVQKPGDLNDDRIVNCVDVSIVRASFGKRTGQQGFDARADVNQDSIVNVSDLAYVLRQLPAGSSCQ